MPQHKVGEKVNDSIWKHPNLIFGAIGIFVYVGAEVSIGSFLVNYFGATRDRWPDGKSRRQLRRFLLGRRDGGTLHRIRASAKSEDAGTLLAICAYVRRALVAISMLTSGHFAMYSIILVGFFNSIMFPSIFTLGVAELGPLTGDGSGVMIMAIVGGAIIPVAQGWIADHIGIHHAFFLPVICYLYILFFALSGSKPNSERHAKA